MKIKSWQKGSIPGQLLFGLITFMFLLCFSVTITLNFRPLYYYDMKALNLAEATGYSEELIRTNYDRLIDYNNFWNHGDLEFLDMSMSHSAKIHFEQVKELFILFEVGAIFFGILLILVILHTIRQRVYGWLLAATLSSVIIPGIFGLMAAVNWEALFIGFHELVFDNDFWLFNPVTDPIITVLPDTFFLHCALLIAAVIIVGSLVCLLVYLYLHRKVVKNVKNS